MSKRNTVDMSLGAILERSITWGLPASPLFMAMLMVLAYTPSALPAREANMLYLASMAGAVTGCASCLPRRIGMRSRIRLLYCCSAGVILEIAWVALTVGDRGGQAAYTAFGAFLVGLSTAILLVLWLATEQVTSIACELMKYAAALASAFLFYSLLGIAPAAGWISFLFSPATCIPLAIHLKKAASKEQSAQAAHHCSNWMTHEDVPRRTTVCSAWHAQTLLPVSALFVVCGAGISMLGYGGQQAEYGAGLTALVLAAALAFAWRANPAALAGQFAAPLMVVSLCYGSFFETGEPFALFLAGCGAFMAWAIVSLRDSKVSMEAQGLSIASPHGIASLLGWATVCAAIGLAIAYAVTLDARVNIRVQAITLVCILVAVDLLWRIKAFGLPTFRTVENNTMPSAPNPRNDAALLEHSCSLSPREADVAMLLCENRSVSYIATMLDLAPSTIKTHIRHIYEKTGTHSRSDLQLFAKRLREGENG